MASSPSQVIVLCEDQRQFSVINAYLRRCGISRHQIRVAPLDRRRNVDSVLTQIPTEQKALRTRSASARLVIMIDDDGQPESQRRGRIPSSPVDSQVVVFTPRRNIETWIHSVCSQVTVDEDLDYKRQLTAADKPIDCGRGIYSGVRQDPPPSHWPPALIAAIPDWHRLC